MKQDYVAHVTATLDAPVDHVWNALVCPDAMREYMFGANVESDWMPGSEITWKGEFDGKPYEDHGKVLKVDPNSLLQYLHVSQGEDEGHTVTIELTPTPEGTLLDLKQDCNGSEEEKVESEKNWQTMIDGMKKYISDNVMQPRD